MSNAARSFRLVCPPSATPLVEALLRAQGYVFAPEPFSPFCRRLLAEPRPLGSSLAAFFGYIYIQDRSSMLPPLALNPAPGAAVLDMCASPGSKTGFLAQLTGPTGFVLGNEPTPARLGTLRANLHQMNLLHAATCAYSGDALPLRPQSWRAILLDPPCSGWGTAAKHPQVLRLWRGDKIDNLTALQRRLLRQAARLLAQGGRLVYSTCTTNTAENEAQVHFAEEELGLVRVPLPPFPGFVWEEQPGGEGTLRVDGERSGAQGFYVALLKNPARSRGLCGTSLPLTLQLRLPGNFLPRRMRAHAAAERPAATATALRASPWARNCPARRWTARPGLERACRPERRWVLEIMCALCRSRPLPCCRRNWSGKAGCWGGGRAAAWTLPRACAPCCRSGRNRGPAWCWTRRRK